MVTTWRRSRGVHTVAKDESNLKFHINPMLGMLAVAEDVTTLRTELKKFVAVLDTTARRGFTERDGRRFAFSTKTALNVWTVVRAIFRDAATAKDPAMCVRIENARRWYRRAGSRRES